MNVLAIRNLEIAEQQNRPNNQHNPRDPFIELNHVQFIKVFRLTKDLVLYLIECLEPYIRPAMRITDLDITTKVHTYRNASSVPKLIDSLQCCRF